MQRGKKIWTIWTPSGQLFWFCTQFSFFCTFVLLLSCFCLFTAHIFLLIILSIFFSKHFATLSICVVWWCPLCVLYVHLSNPGVLGQVPQSTGTTGPADHGTRKDRQVPWLSGIRTRRKTNGQVSRVLGAQTVTNKELNLQSLGFKLWGISVTRFVTLHGVWFIVAGWTLSCILSC